MDESQRCLIDRLFTEALEVSPGERSCFLDERCSGDALLRSAVERLLTSAEADDDFLRPGGALQSSVWRALSSEQTTTLPPPQRVGVYRIAREIGRGGMAVVYLGERDDGAFEQRVALKLIKPGTDTQEVLQRFGQERQILASLNHPSIARLYDGGSTETGYPYFVMELVEGEPIDMYCRARGLAIEARLELFVMVCDAVHYAHEKDIVHRDLKPSNILVSADGRVKLLDFGIAKALDPQVLRNAAPATQRALRLLTPEFASPEQVRGEPVTVASDVYQLGVLVYLLLADRLPYRLEREGTEALSRAICDQTPLPPSTLMTRSGTDPDEHTETTTAGVVRLGQRLSGGLDTIVLRALHKEPGHRYSSAAEFAGDLRRHLDASALGCTLYEMLIGQRAVPEKASVDALAVVPKREPDSKALPRDLPPAARRLVQQWFSDGAEWTVTRRGLHWAHAGWIAAAAVTVALVVVTASLWPEEQANRRALQFRYLAPEGVNPGGILGRGNLAVAPDGSAIVYKGGDGALRLRRLDETHASPLVGTEGMGNPFWSPDGLFLGFTSNRLLRRLDLRGEGPPRTVLELDTEGFFGPPSWGADGSILYATPPPARAGIFRVSAEGGDPVAVTRAEQTPGWDLHGFPEYLPDGRRFLFVAQGAKRPQLHIGSLDDGEVQPIRGVSSSATFVEPGYLIYAQGASLVARRFDPDAVRWLGEPALLVPAVSGFQATGSAAFAVSSDVVVSSYWSQAAQMVWFDRNGDELGTLGEPGGVFGNRISPSGDRVVVSVADPATGLGDLWIYELARGVGTRITSTEDIEETSPVWSPDGSRIAFGSSATGPPDLRTRAADGSGVETIVVSGPGGHLAQDWAADGSLLLYRSAPAEDLWLAPLDGNAPRPYVEALGRQDRGRFSPDGRWVAFESSELGRFEVFVAPVSDGSARQRVSRDGGTQPVWRQDGRALYYVRSNIVVAVPIATDPQLEIGAPSELFRLEPNRSIAALDVGPDAGRFLVTAIDLDPEQRRTLNVLVDWRSLLQR